jgi:hypothetical protein
MRCNNAHQLISIALDEPLSEYDRSGLERHLESCPACARHRALLLRGRELLGVGLVAPAENFEWKVQLGIQRALRAGAAAAELPRSPRRFWLPAGASAIVVASLVVIAGTFWLRSHGLEEVTPTRDVAQIALHEETRPTVPNLEGAVPVDVLPDVPYVRPGFGIQEASARYQPTRNVGMRSFVDGASPSWGYLVVGEDPALAREIEWLRQENSRLRGLVETGHSSGAAIPADSVNTVEH